MTRLAGAWRNLGAEQRLAGYAALGLLVSMLLPWYEKKTTGVIRGHLENAPPDNLSAFQVFSFVEAAVLLVAAGVLWLLFTRGERRAFHLPGGDGNVILAAGLWAALLFFWRLFDKPSAGGGPQLNATIGIQWGFLVAFVAAGALAFAGSRVRAAHRPEPPNPIAQPEPGSPRRGSWHPTSAPGRDGSASARGARTRPERSRSPARSRSRSTHRRRPTACSEIDFDVDPAIGENRTLNDRDRD